MPDDQAPAIGHNRAPFIEVYTDLNTDLQKHLDTDHSWVGTRTKELMDAFKTVPAILDADTAPVVSDILAQITAHCKAADAAREALVAPVLKAQRQVNGFYDRDCFDKLDTPKSQVGIKQQLNTRMTAHLQRVADEERRRREEAERVAAVAAAEAARIAEEEHQRAARAAAEEAARLADEERKRVRAAAEERRRADEAAAAIKNAKDLEAALALEALERVRRVEREEVARVEAAASAVRQAERDATAKASADEAARAQEAADKAAREAAAKPAELAIVRGGYGSGSSLRTTWTATIEDLATVDLNAIREFIAEEAVQKALNAMVKIHHDRKPVKGVKFHQVSSNKTRG